MQITNLYNLPEPIYRAVSQVRKPSPDRITVTELVAPPLMKTLRIRFWDQLTEDASRRLWLLLGTAVHYVIDMHTPADALAEERLERIVAFTSGGAFTQIKVVGRPDLWHSRVITDWKVTSVGAFMRGEKVEWKWQVNVYDWLYESYGFQSDELRIYAILRNHDEMMALRRKDYPRIPFVNQKIEKDPSTEDYVYRRVAEHLTNPEGVCSDEERWKKETEYAVMREGRKTALRVLQTHQEAELWMAEEAKKPRKKASTSAPMRIDVRPGEFARCARYCQVACVCPYNPYREKPEEESGNGKETEDTEGLL